jgi:hypothetical protein
MDLKYKLIPFCGYPILIVETKELLNENELTFLKNLKTTEHPKNNYFPNRHDFKLTESVQILNNIELKRIKDFVWKNFCNYLDYFLEIENQFYMCNSWSTFQKKGNFHKAHSHTNAIFSSAFYAQSDGDALRFSTLKPKICEGFNFDYNVKNYNVFNSSTWDLKVKTGDIVFFPGELTHESIIHESDNDRIMIGSSYFIKGKTGLDGRYNSINISDANE